ncbi:MAG: adenylate/guanylate cyclase domain-containing protein [Burkholderiaceae bacterium]
MRAGRWRLWVGFVAVMLVSAVLEYLPPIRQAELTLLDAQWQLLRRLVGPHSAAPADDPVVVGIDEASYRSIEEPFALWHRPLGELFAAFAAAAPRAVLVDVALPERSYDGILPGSSAALLHGVKSLVGRVPTVFALTIGPGGEPRPVMPALLAVAGAGSFALALVPVDADGRVRRLWPDEGGDTAPPTLVQALAIALGARHAGDGSPPPLIDYALGAPFDYLPMHRLLEAHRRGDSDALRILLGGRPVVVGSVLAYADRLASPLPLAAWEAPGVDPPGLLVHAQALRTLLARRAIVQLPAAIPVALALLCSALWWVTPLNGRTLAFTIAVVAGVLMLSSSLLYLGAYLPAFAAIRSALLATSMRKTLEATLALRERRRLRATFGGYVSPQVLDRMIDGELDPSRPDGPRTMAFLFADLRGFTTRGQTESALDTVGMLNRYYESIIGPIHENGGMVDNFRGDGIMVVFGAPQPLADPGRAAVLAAAGMVRSLSALNRALAAEGRAALEMGVGIASGSAVAGEIGSRLRHDYTAIGDAVNVAARLQDQCKVFSAQAVVCAETARSLNPGEASLRPLGDLELRGHAPVAACAIEWPELAPARVE